MRRLLVGLLIRLLEKDVGPQRVTLTKDEEDILLSQLWQSPAFRKRVADRDARLIHAMAGGEGMAPEPRDAYCLHAGQRVECLLWARDAKLAYERDAKRRVDKETLTPV